MTVLTFIGEFVIAIIVYILLIIAFESTDKTKYVKKEQTTAISFWGLPVNEKTLYETIYCNDDTTLYFYESYKLTLLNENNEAVEEYSGLSSKCMEKMTKRILPSKDIVKMRSYTGFLIELHDSNDNVLYSEEYLGCFIEAQDYALKRFRNETEFET